jgi:hypothetical protein
MLLPGYRIAEATSSSFKEEFCIQALSQCYPADRETKGTLHIQEGMEQLTVTYRDISWLHI